ncbi:MAG: hypothetical protein ASARMPRED_004570 [Alectoria sarmentosa]|nr:MAG: hypothetical protein ASARMPRED_004570 [Alectoria sarmentosa]
MHLPTLLLSLSTHCLAISSLTINSPSTSLITPSINNLTLSDVPDPQCVKITDPPMLGLNPTNCEIALPIICNRLTQPRPERLLRDKWIWTELPGCSLGYYLPEDAPVPWRGQCERTFESILELCSMDSRFNAGGINVEEMPDFSGDGRAVREGRLRFAMAPERLTLPL